MSTTTISCVKASIFVLIFVCVSQDVLSAPDRFLNFLLQNKWDSGLPRSYRVPTDYFKKIPIAPANNASIFVPMCNRVVTIQELDAYTAQTEEFLTSFGINLYDAAVREIALALLGHGKVAQQYEIDTLISGKTLQFGNIRGDAPCNGITYFGQCTDTQQSGSCGFCYGGNNGDKRGESIPTANAFFFRMISDVYAYAGANDMRCPEKNIAWAWNDWRPVAGENAWANLIGPLQVAYLQAGKYPNAIDDNSPAIQLAVRIFSTIQKSQMPNGAIAYSPWNTYDYENPALGGTASVENGASLLSGLKIFASILENKSNTQYKALVPQIRAVSDKLLQFIKSSYSPSLGYFRQGGGYVQNGWQWNEDPNSGFAVDCQTWVISVVGAPTIDSWFGEGTTFNLWQTTKKIGGFGYNSGANTVVGLGFGHNQQVQVFSGEWSFGAVNMLRTLAKQLPAHAQVLRNEADNIRQAIDDFLTTYDNEVNSDVINYANKRYKIPWGWWANPISSTASIAWAVMVDSNYNPFQVGGDY